MTKVHLVNIQQYSTRVASDGRGKSLVMNVTVLYNTVQLVIFVGLIFCGLGTLDDFVGLYFCDVPTLIT